MVFEGESLREENPYSWLWVLIAVMTVVTLAIGGLAFHYIETRTVATVGETLALTAAEVSDKVDRFLFERYGDVLLMAGTSARSHPIGNSRGHILAG